MTENYARELRQQAEDRLRATATAAGENLSAQDMRRLVHELQVHQIELEMQNDELRQAQQQLEASHARYFELYDLAPVGYCTVSEQGFILEANLTAALLLGTSRSALVQQPVSRYIVKADQDTYYKCRKELFASHEPQLCELQMLHSDGTTVWVHVVVSLTQDGDSEPLQRMVLTDITERRHLNRALQVRNTDLESARQVADKANLAKSEFLSSMSHELRSPLHAILGFAQLLEGGPPTPTPTQQASIGQILRAGWYLLGLISEILDLSLVESGHLTLASETISISDVLRDCRAMIDPLAQKQGIHLYFPSDASDYCVVADPIRFKQVVVNLLSNAIKYNRAGGTVEVTVSEPATQRLRISVRDTGQGLSVNNLAHLFEPFNRLGQETGVQEGTGIGLAISRRLVEAMGGTIGASSTPGVGSIFWVEFDRAKARTVLYCVPEVVKPAPGITRRPGRRTLLCIEDNPANLALVEQLVARRAELRLLSAGDGVHGVVLARTHLPDVILMDITLPGLNGNQALALLREDPTTRHIPVLALSANAMPDDIEKGLAAGFFRYLTKPMRIDAFMQALDEALAAADTPKG